LKTAKGTKKRPSGLYFFNMKKLECKYGFYTCSNLIKELHIKSFCDTCDEGQNYQDKDDFKTVIKKK
tara:strand:- start:8715 stop:8915 length:201 start_codon:yes stop_codon:yes gene_type:complete